MPAFNSRRFGELEKALTNFYNRVQHNLLQLDDITQEELLQLFIKPEHHEQLTSVVKIARVEGLTNFTYEVRAPIVEHNKIRITFYLGGDNPLFIVPKYAGEFIISNKAPEAMNKLEQWLQARWEYGKSFGLAKAVLEDLNDLCDNPTQMRFFLKSLTALGYDVPYRVPRDIPNIPLGLRVACKDVDTLIAKASLFSEPEHITIDKPVTVVYDARIYLPNPWSKKENYRVWD